MSEVNVREFKKLHKVGFLKVPANLAEMPKLKAVKGFLAPSTVDLRDYCTATEDQGSKPWCAAYTAAGWTENIKWRINDTIEQIDPTPIYKYAKTIDGDPYGDGTTLSAVLESLLHLGYFDRSKCRIRTIVGGAGAKLAVKYAVHKFGCVLSGFNITDEWYEKNSKDSVVTGDPKFSACGGHAVLICGYNKHGVIIQNSWGKEWGKWGFGLISWNAFNTQFMYGAVLSNALDGLTLNT